ncbi:MAG: hypothetical protein WAK17_23190 [Candidatus Nitrosopolaris sp.]
MKTIEDVRKKLQEINEHIKTYILCFRDYTHCQHLLAYLTEKIETFSLLAGVTAAIAAIILFLIRWNSTLDNQIKRRTRELDTLSSI